jgi:hypothetical protein
MTVNAAGTTGVLNDTSSYHVYRIDVDVQGNAVFSVDGLVGYTMASTVGARATIPLCGYFDVVTLTGSGANTSAVLDIDYVFVGGSSNWKTRAF